MNIDKTQTAPPDTREIPPPPGGGSWTFDRDNWEWVSNDPVPAPTEETPAAAVEYDGTANQE
jgi:hypothetical protein